MEGIRPFFFFRGSIHVLNFKFTHPTGDRHRSFPGGRFNSPIFVNLFILFHVFFEQIISVGGYRFPNCMENPVAFEHMSYHKMFFLKFHVHFQN